jgi:CoA:oxalate CoA-transferase
VPDQAFAVRDGYVAISARTQEEWERLCRVLGLEKCLADPRYRDNATRITHRAPLIAELEAVLAPYPAAWWLQVLGQAGVPCGRFHTCEEMSQHPQVRQNGLMAELPTPHWGTVRVAGLPWSFSLTPGVLRAGPLPGSDTAAVLQEVLGEQVSS